MECPCQKVREADSGEVIRVEIADDVSRGHAVREVFGVGHMKVLRLCGPAIFQDTEVHELPHVPVGHHPFMQVVAAVVIQDDKFDFALLSMLSRMFCGSVSFRWWARPMQVVQKEIFMVCAL